MNQGQLRRAQAAKEKDHLKVPPCRAVRHSKTIQGFVAPQSDGCRKKPG